MEEKDLELNENTEEKKENKKSKGILMDIIVALIGVVVLIVCYFFWGCKYDLPATILAIVVILAGSGLLYMQHKRNNKDADKDAQAQN